MIGVLRKFTIVYKSHPSLKDCAILFKDILEVKELDEFRRES